MAFTGLKDTQETPVIVGSPTKFTGLKDVSSTPTVGSTTQFKGLTGQKYVPPQSTLSKVAEFVVPTITKTAGKIKRGEDVTARDIGGSALEAASFLIPGGAIAKGVGGVIKAGTLASKIAIPAIAGGIGAASYGAGQAVAGGKDIGGVAKEALKSGIIGTTVVGTLGTIGAGLAARKLAQKTPETYLTEATKRAEFGPIPEAAKAPERGLIIIPGQKIQDTTPIQLPSPSVAQGQRAIYQPPTITPEIPIVKGKKGTVIKPTEIKPTEPTSTITQPIPTPKQEVSPIPVVKDPVSVLKESTPIKPGEDPIIAQTTFKQQTDLYNTHAVNTPTDTLIDMSMGKTPLPEGLAKNTVYELTKNRTDLTVDQVRRLANTAPESEAGLNLVLTKLRSGGIIDNATDFIKATETQLKDVAQTKGITQKTINRFLDGIECQ